MNVTVWVSKLQEVLDLCYRFVSKHSTLPVLENIYIKSNIDSLVFRATDMEKYIDVEISAKIDSEWAITVNAKTLTDIIKTINDKEVKLMIDDSTDTLLIKSASDDFKIKWIPATEYVAVPEISSINSIKINANYFAKWVSKVDYAVTERNFSPVLTWVLMRIKKYWDEFKLIFVWTDSFRLAEYKISIDWVGDEMDLIVPKVNIWDIKKVADYFVSKWWESMNISFSENLVSFSFQIEDIKILTTSLLIQWTFPDYENENIIPTQFNTKILVDKSSIDLSIRKISILTRDINNFIDISVDNAILNITSWETDKWEAKTNLTIVKEWENMSFWVNGKYIQDFIRTCDWVSVWINIVSWEKPIVLKDQDDVSYTYVVRPLVK